MMEALKISDKAKEYIKTVMGECVGCIETEIAQDLDGNLIKVVTNSHGGVGFILEHAYAPLDGREHMDDKCTLPDDQKRGNHVCSTCWMRAPEKAEATHD
jgi:hypothetical protein